MYYYQDKYGQQQGPVPANDLPRYGVTPQTLVWKQGMSAWQPAGMAAELSAVFVAPVAPPPTSPLPPPTAPPPQSYSPPPSPVEVKGGALKYVLLGIGGFIVLCIVLCVGRYFFYEDFRKGDNEDFQESYQKGMGKPDENHDVSNAVNRQVAEAVSGSYTAREKTFFHSEPDASTVRKAYLIEGDKVYVEKTNNGFGYVTFTNTKGTVTKGWLKMSDLTNAGRDSGTSGNNNSWLIGEWENADDEWEILEFEEKGKWSICTHECVGGVYTVEANRIVMQVTEGYGGYDDDGNEMEVEKSTFTIAIKNNSLEGYRKKRSTDGQQVASSSSVQASSSASSDNSWLIGTWGPITVRTTGIMSDTFETETYQIDIINENTMIWTNTFKLTQAGIRMAKSRGTYTGDISTSRETVRFKVDNRNNRLVFDDPQSSDLPFDKSRQILDIGNGQGSNYWLRKAK